MHHNYSAHTLQQRPSAAIFFFLIKNTNDYINCCSVQRHLDLLHLHKQTLFHFQNQPVLFHLYMGPAQINSVWLLVVNSCLPWAQVLHIRMVVKGLTIAHGEREQGC